MGYLVKIAFLALKNRRKDGRVQGIDCIEGYERLIWMKIHKGLMIFTTW